MESFLIQIFVAVNIEFASESWLNTLCTGMVPDTCCYYLVVNKVKYLTLMSRNWKLWKSVIGSEIIIRLLRITEEKHWTELRLVSKLWSPPTTHTHLDWTHLKFKSCCFLGTVAKRLPGKCTSEINMPLVFIIHHLL